MMRMKSIGSRFVLQIAFVITIIMITVGIVTLSQQQKKFRNFLEAKAELVLHQLTIGLGNPIWNLDPSQINNVIHAYLRDPDILSIKVMDTVDTTYHWGKDPVTLEIVDFAQKSTQEIQYANVFTPQAAPHVQIVFDEDRVGTAEVTFSRQFIISQVRETAILVGIILVALIIIETLVILVLVKRGIATPLKTTVYVAERIAKGELEMPLHTGSKGSRVRDEIGTLLHGFHRMTTYLHEMATVATQVATGVLDGEVRVRSKHDILGKAVQEMLDYLKHVATVMTRVADGDLTGTVHVRSTDDAFGQVIQSMTKGLRTLIVRIRNSAEQIASTGATIASFATHDIDIVQNVNNSMEHVVSTMHEMGASVEEVVHNMDLLSSSVEETSASVVQMTSTVAYIASNTTTLHNQTQQTVRSLDETVQALEAVVENTDTSQHLAQETIKDALEGQKAIEQVITSMETIQQTVTAAVDTITRFEQRSREIDTVLDVIREITEQTSLLALNASIIAAQAGVHGRGFAVVADEIRNLADGVRTSTKDIAFIVNTLQEDTQQVVQAIHIGAENVKQGMEHTQQARHTLQKITSSAQRSSSVVTEITEALHGLMATSRNVSLAMEQVSTMTDEITIATNEHQDSTRQIQEAIRYINDMSSQIQQATAQQATGVRQVLEAAHGVTILIDQNLKSSQQISQTTEILSSQADILLSSVGRFKLPS